VYDLLRLEIIFEKATRDPIQPLVIASHQRGKGRRIARPHAGKQLGIGQALWRPFGGCHVLSHLLPRSSP
jgi:hypothetical protein